MSDIVIGFGGTGAKIVQAFLMMGASGALKLERPVKILLVDQDKSNGNTLRTVDTLETYQKVKKLTVSNPNGDPQPLSAAFETYATAVWQPLKQANERLGTYFQYDDNATKKDLNSRLLEILYAAEQIKAPLDHGFLGNPNMGAPVFANAINFSEQPWKRLDEDIGKGLSEGGTRIVLCGSVFGGTGAAGIPNVAKVLRERHKVGGTAPNEGEGAKDASEPKIILNLAMPYFGIRQVEGAAVQASGKDFLPNAKAALQYYHDQKYLDFCDAIYVLGEADMAPIEKAHLGDLLQRNSAHPLELFAACNIYHSLITKDPSFLSSKFILTVRADRHRYTWEDLPVPDKDFVRSRMGAFARFCFAFLCYREGLKNYHTAGFDKMNEFLPTFFPAQKDLTPDAVSSVEKLASLFLVWAGEMELTAHSMPNGYRAEWFDPQLMVEGDPAKLEVQLRHIDDKSIEYLKKVVLPLHSDEKLEGRELLRALNKERGTATGMGGFINTLYAICGNRLRGFQSASAARGGR